MSIRNRATTHSRPFRLAALAAALSAMAVSTAGAQQVFDRPDTAFEGTVRATSPLVLPGGEVELAGRGFKPGQSVTLSRGGAVLNQTPYVAGEDGSFTAKLQLPANAVPGRHPVVAVADNPDAALVFELKISPKIPLSGQDGFAIAGEKRGQGLYQSAYSAKNDVLFVTSAVGRPPVTQSELLKIDPKTLEILARTSPAKVPGRDDGRVYAVYGVGVDDANGNVWVTNTRDDTVAVYRQSDLSLLKQFDAGTVPHSRDVVVDQRRGKAYASATGENFISVFDARSLAFVKNIEIESTVRGEKFVPMSLELDEASGKLFTVSIGTPEAVVIDTAKDTVDNVFKLSNASSASGVAYDAANARLLVASQGSDNLLFVDVASGSTIFDVPVGAGPLNVAFDPVTKLAYVSNRASGTVTVVDGNGRIVGNLAGGTFPNHVHEDGKGSVFAINKARGEDDPEGDRITRIAPKQR